MDDRNNPFESVESGAAEEPTSFFGRMKQKIGLGGSEPSEKQPPAAAAAEAEPAGEGTLYDKIAADSTGLGRLLSKLPGLGGYMEKSRRREADALLRRTIADRLRESRNELSNVYQELSRDIIMAMDYAEPLGRTDTRLVGLIGKIEDAPAGYAGFFNAIKIKEEELARIYEFDERMLDHASFIGANVAALQKATRDGGDMRAALRDLDTAVQNAQLAFNERQELLSGFA